MPISILILEENPADAEEACVRLKAADISHECDRVQTRDSFQSALIGKSYDLILADYAVRDLSGNEALDLAHRIAPEVPFIFLSAVPGEQVAIDVLQRGATDYILKTKLERLAPAVLRALAEVREKQQRRRIETALRDSERRYRMLVEAVPQLIWTCTPDGQADFLNSQWVEFTGIPAEEQLGLRWLEQVHPEDQERARTGWLQSAESGRNYDTEYRLRSASGGYRWMKVRAIAVKNGRGLVQKWFGSSTDIQDRKEAEEELLRRTDALARSNADLQQFAYIASHDLQEPLRSVISYTQLLQKRYRGRLDQDADEFIQFAVDGATRMQKLILDLLEYSRAGSEGGQGQEQISLEKLLKTALSRLSALLDRTGAVVTYENLPKVSGQQAELTQVLENLISNALKYQRPNVPPQVHISAKKQDHRWRISVRDNGMGFDPEAGERIFGIFQRLQPRQVPGTGMGLAICRRIIEATGGKIWAESTPGEGSTFHFTVRAA